MTPVISAASDAPSPELADRIDQVCDRFEADWRAGLQPRIESFLETLPESARPSLFRELLALEREFRARAGARPDLDGYRQRFPEFAHEISRVFADARVTLGAPVEGAGVVRYAQDDSPRTAQDAPSDGIRYRVLRLHARGGLGEVFVAHDEEVDREVALKQIRDQHADEPQSRARFVREARLTGRLEHPGIVPIHGLGQDRDGRPYYTMRLVKGESLKEAIRRFHESPEGPENADGRTLTLRRLLGRFVDVCDAVSYAHSRGVLHRDIKPSNIMLGSYGETLVVDWGLAKPMDGPPDGDEPGEALVTSTLNDGSEPTRAGSAVGTPSYMSPEQAAGDLDQVGPASDVYSLGATLYCLLTGQPPLEGRDKAEVLANVRQGDVKPPRQIKPKISTALQAICLKAMALKPADRYPSPRGLADDLEHWLGDEPVSAWREPSFVRLARWSRRHRPLVTGFGVAIAALLIALASGAILVGRQKLAAEANLYRALVGEARAQMQGRDTGWRWEAMSNIDGASRLNVAARDPVELRELAIQTLGSRYPAFRLLAAWEGHSGAVLSVAFSPDERLAMTGSRDRTARIWSMPEGRPLAVLAGHEGPLTAVAFHPAGRLAASSSNDGTIRLWDVSPFSAPASAHAKDVPIAPPDSERAVAPGRALHRPEAPTRVFPSPASARTVAPLRVVTLNAGSVRSVAFSSDGTWLAAGCEDGTVRLLALGSEAGSSPSIAAIPNAQSDRWYSLKGHSAPVNSVAFSPSAPLLASGSDDRTIRFWDIRLRTPTMSWSAANPVTWVEFNPPGAGLAWSDPESYGFASRQLSKTTPLSLAHLHAGAVTQVRWRGDRFLTASRDGTMRLWSPSFESNRITELALAGGEFGAVYCALATRAENRVLAGYLDGKVRLWELAEPPERVFLDAKTQNAVFIGDERRLVHRNVVYQFDSLGAVTAHPFAPSEAASLALHPDGERFAVGMADGTLALHDLPRPRERAKWAGHRGRVNGLVGSPVGDRLASASSDGTVGIWDWTRGRLIKRIDPGLGELHGVAWNRDGSRLAAIGSLGVVTWSEAGDGPIERVSDAPRLGGAVAFGPDALAFSGPDGAIEVHDASSGQRRHLLRGHTSVVSALEFSPDGGRLASGAADGTVRLWDPVAGVGATVFKDPSVTASSLAFDPLGRYLLSTNNNATLVWDMRPGAVVTEYMVLNGQAARFTQDGSAILMAMRSGSVGVCRVAELEAARTVAQGSSADAPLVGAVLVHPKEELIPGGHISEVWGIAASPDGRWVATAAHEGSIKLWDARTMALVRTLVGHKGAVWCVAFSPDSKTLASGADKDPGGDVKLWDVPSGRERMSFDGHDQIVFSVAFHPHKPWLVTGSGDRTVRLWDVSAERPLGVLHRFDQPVRQLAFRPDGRWLAVACDDQRVALWDLERSSAPRPPDRWLTGHTSSPASVGFSPDGRTLASGANQGVVMLWDGETFDRIVTIRGGTGQIRGISFSRDGELLSTAAYASHTIVWNLRRLRGALREMNLDWR
jgi:eukaryotic-like serine/threonine-protein kinase